MLGARFVNAIVLSTSLCGSFNVFAEITVCNQRNHTVSVSMAYTQSFTDYDDCMAGCITVHKERDVVAGWSNIPAHTCETISDLDGTTISDKNIYFRAEYNGSLEMGGDRFSRICYNPTKGFRYYQERAVSSGITIVPVYRDANGRSNHPTLADCSDLKASKGAKNAAVGEYQQFYITSKDWTLTLTP